MQTRGNSIDDVRRRNLAIVLGLIHRDGPASRAAITAATGLNRSTVAALVAELEALGLLVEGDPVATNRVGRPSPVVSASERPVALAVNPELDAVTVGVVGLGARVEHRVRREVDRVVTAEEAVDLVAEVVAGMRSRLARRRVLGVGLAVPGLVRAGDGVVRWAPHLGWRESDVAAALGSRLGLPAYAGNDATLGARAEHLFGVGRGVDDLVYLNGGASGIGGGIVLGGRVIAGAGGYAGEFGQGRPGIADPADRRAEHGALEDEVSRARLLEVLGLASADEPALEAALRARADEPAVRAEAERQRRVLAVSVANAVNALDPSLVVLGGFLAALLALDPEGFAALVGRHALATSAEGLRITPAALGQDRLLIGAAELVLAPVLADPALAAAPAQQR